MSGPSDDEFDTYSGDYGQQDAGESDNPDRPRTEVLLPPLRLVILRPFLTVQWISAAVEGWLWTRAWLTLLPGLPFAAAAISLIVLMIETPGDLRDQINLLRTQIQDPESRKHPEMHELRLRALSGLLPDDHTPLLARARFAADEGRFDDAVQLMLRLSEWGDLGIAEAHVAGAGCSVRNSALSLLRGTARTAPAHDFASVAWSGGGPRQSGCNTPESW